MKNKAFVLGMLVLVSACKSIKPDYVVMERSDDKTKVWVNNLKKYEKTKESESDKYKYFVAEGNSIEKNLCKRNAINNVNTTIAGEISTEIDNLYTGLINVKGEESIINNDKKEQSKMIIRNKLSGVEPVETYWEKRKYSVELGAEKDKVSYTCYQLSRVKRKVHDTIINEMVDRKIKTIRDEEKKEEAKKVIEENAEKSNINLELK